MITKSILITGASSGIGRATALHLSGRGWRVFAGVRKTSDGIALSDEAEGDLTPVILDVADPMQISAARQTLDEALGEGGLGALINNAGLVISLPLEMLTADALRHQFEVNVIGVHAVTREMLPLLRAGHGQVVSIGSTSGLVTFPLLGPYSASKSALKALTRALRMELKPSGVDVSLIEAGNIRTPIWPRSNEDARRRFEAGHEEHKARYGALVEHALTMGEKMADSAVSVERVVAVLEKLLSDTSPKACYRVGPDARLWVVLTWLLPWSWLEATITRVFKLHRSTS